MDSFPAKGKRTKELFCKLYSRKNPFFEYQVDYIEDPDSLMEDVKNNPEYLAWINQHVWSHDGTKDMGPVWFFIPSLKRNLLRIMTTVFQSAVNNQTNEEKEEVNYFNSAVSDDSLRDYQKKELQETRKDNNQKRIAGEKIITSKPAPNDQTILKNFDNGVLPYHSPPVAPIYFTKLDSWLEYNETRKKIQSSLTPIKLDGINYETEMGSYNGRKGEVSLSYDYKFCRLLQYEYSSWKRRTKNNDDSLWWYTVPNEEWDPLQTASNDPNSLPGYHNLKF
tara:strand:- start:40196 stop:41032 length:837 start_codon:yes stop_codon:yes gene_type:complete